MHNSPSSSAALDDRYEALLNAHNGLSRAQSERLNAALILLLANEIADTSALRGFIDTARNAVLAREEC
jgi:hypothetical protein